MTLSKVKEYLVVTLLALGCVAFAAFIPLAVSVNKRFNQGVTTLETQSQAALDKANKKVEETADQVKALTDKADKVLGTAQYALQQYGDLAKESKSLVADVHKELPGAKAFALAKSEEITQAVVTESGVVNAKLDVAMRPLSIVGTELAFITNCDENSDNAAGQDCLFNRYQGTAHSIEKTLLAWYKVAPELSQHALGISNSADAVANDVKKVADYITRKRTKKEKLLNLFNSEASVGVRIAALFF